MRDTAVFAYVVAVFIVIATVIFSFVNIYNDHSTYALGAALIGVCLVAVLWSMANWIEKHNA